jgi:hypothetical protein
MNTRLSSCALGVAVLFASVATYAADLQSRTNGPGFVASDEFGPAMTAKERTASIAAAMRSGEIQRGEANWPSPAPVDHSSLSRVEVKGAARQAEIAGVLPRGEAQLAAAPSQPSTLARAEVKAETVAAVRLHQIPRGEAAMFNPRENQKVQLGAAPAEHGPKVASREQPSEDSLILFEERNNP